MRIKIIHKSKHELPAYASDGASGMDLRANIDEPITLQPMQRTVIDTGIHIALPPALEAHVRPRSGLAAKHGITVLNSPGTIDSDFRGEIKVILVNLSEDEFVVKDGDRIAQLVVAPYLRISWDLATTLDHTGRGDGGLGSTGLA